MKNLANCKPSEFVVQTNAIRHYVEKWFKLTGIPDIRKKLPTIPEGATDDEKKSLFREQSRKNFAEMLDAALEQHPAETVGLLALACFVPVEEADEHPMDFYFEAIADILESNGVIRFFYSLANLERKSGT